MTIPAVQVDVAYMYDPVPVECGRDILMGESQFSDLMAETPDLVAIKNDGDYKTDKNNRCYSEWSVRDMMVPWQCTEAAKQICDICQDRDGNAQKKREKNENCGHNDDKYSRMQEKNKRNDLILILVLVLFC